MNPVITNEKSRIYVDPSFNLKNGDSVVYVTNKYQCTWERGRSEEDFNNTYMHEKCHDLTYDNYEHFCEGDYVSERK